MQPAAEPIQNGEVESGMAPPAVGGRGISAGVVRTRCYATRYWLCFDPVSVPASAPCAQLPVKLLPLMLS